jgi:hypothetical protein
MGLQRVAPLQPTIQSNRIVLNVGITVESMLGQRTAPLKSRPTSEQHREFVKAARELGTDESEEAFDKVLKRIAKAPPPRSVRKRKTNPKKTPR